MAVQAYLRDASRVLKLKIYKVKIYRNDEMGWSDTLNVTADESTMM